MAWEEIGPPAKAGRGEYVVISTWKRGGLGIVLSPALAARLTVRKGTRANLAHNPDTGQLRVAICPDGRHTFAALKGAALIRFGTVRGLVIHPGKHFADWNESTTGDAVVLTIESLGHKPRAVEPDAKPAPAAAPPAAARPSTPPSLAPRDRNGRPISRAADPRYQIPGGR